MAVGGIFSYLPIGHIMLLSILLNNVCVCKAEVTEVLNSQLLSWLEPFQNLSGLPKNHEFTEEEVYNNTQEYEEGMKNEDVYLNGTQLIQKYGYESEEHYVITSDGYNLSMYRIPGKGRVVFLMHGLIESFVDWLTAGPEKGLAYLLAAAGFDVWMGNARGNTFSKRHIHLSPSNPKFWDFSWDEIGRFDLPAMIDYVLETTGQETLTYVGHSQGTTSFFVLCSERPEYNDKIDLMIALSAAAWMKHVTNPFVQIISQFYSAIDVVGRALGLNDVFPDNDLQKVISRTFCGNSPLASILCQNVYFLAAGFDYPQIDYRQSPVIFNHFPAGSSLKQFVHYGQLVVSGYFRQYDNGIPLNMVKYGSPVPPSYPVENITAPIAIFYSYGDWLVSPIDVQILASKLPNLIDYYQLPLLTFNHFDFLWAKDVKHLVYDRVLKLIGEANKKM